MTRSKKRFFLLILTAVCTLLVTAGLNWNALVIEYKLLRDFKSLGMNEQSYPEYEHLRSGIVMVLLPGGEFMMGSPEDEPGRRGDEILRQKVIGPFLISKYEVSQEIWEKIMGSNPSEYKGPKLPVEHLSWDDCYGDSKSFCSLVELTLPTEDQWEYACRAGTSTPYNFGKTINALQAWSLGLFEIDDEKPIPPSLSNRTVFTCEVTSFKPNQFGLHNMHGNVAEWCKDVYDMKGFDPEKKLDEEDSDWRVVRGGGWRSPTESLRSAHRSFWEKDDTENYIGFRPVYNLAP